MGSSMDRPPAPVAGAAAQNAKLVGPFMFSSRPSLALAAVVRRLGAQAHPAIAAGA